MTRRPFKPNRSAAAMQAASLLAVASGVFGILINDIIRHKAEVAMVKALSDVQPFASQQDPDLKSR